MDINVSGVGVFSWPGPYPVTTMQRPNDVHWKRMWQVFTATPCSVFTLAILQDVQTGMSFVNLKTYWLSPYIFIYPLVRHLNIIWTLIYQGFWWCLMKSTTWFLVFWACFAFIFVFWKKILDMVICITSKKIKALCVNSGPLLCHSFWWQLQGNQAKLDCGHCIDDLRATFNLCICCL